MMHIVCVRDSVAEVYLLPFFVPAVGVAYRSLQDEVRRGGEGNALANHPKDFALFSLGLFDQATGLIVADKPVLLCEVSALVEVEP